MAKRSAGSRGRARAHAGGEDAGATAERLHRAAIRLLRRLRVADDETGVSAPKLSALSVLVFAGPQSLKALAAAEQVTPATMSRLVSDLAAEGLVEKAPDPGDARGLIIAPSERGRALMQAGRARRLALLRARLKGLRPAELALLDRAARLIERVAGGEG